MGDWRFSKKRPTPRESFQNTLRVLLLLQKMRDVTPGFAIYDSRLHKSSYVEDMHTIVPHIEKFFKGYEL